MIDVALAQDVLRRDFPEADLASVAHALFLSSLPPRTIVILRQPDANSVSDPDQETLNDYLDSVEVSCG